MPDVCTLVGWSWSLACRQGLLLSWCYTSPSVAPELGQITPAEECCRNLPAGVQHWGRRLYISQKCALLPVVFWAAGLWLCKGKQVFGNCHLSASASYVISAGRRKHRGLFPMPWSQQQNKQCVWNEEGRKEEEEKNCRVSGLVVFVLVLTLLERLCRVCQPCVLPV